MRQVQKFTSMLCIIFVFAIISGKNLSAEEGESVQAIAANSLTQCLLGHADYMLGKVNNLNAIEVECEAGHFVNQPLHRDILGPIEGPKNNLVDLGDDALDQCHMVWRSKVEAAINIALSELRQPEMANPHKRSATEPLQKLEVMLKLRSLAEAELTRVAMEDRSFYGSFDGQDCTFPILQISAFRAENIAFLMNHHVLELYMAKKLSPDIYYPLWFMIQHADLQPWFQEEWLNVLLKTHQENGFPVSRVESLERRVALAKKRREKKDE